MYIRRTLHGLMDFAQRPDAMLSLENGLGLWRWAKN
jgi:hypothetical protein